MKKEYDFSKGERGKFFKKNVQINVPVYLDKTTLPFVNRLANLRKTNISVIVNSLIKEDIRLAEIMQ